MEQIDKDLLLKDLCARLPYGVIFKDEFDENLQEIHYIKNEDIFSKNYSHLPYWIETIKPYLRLLSSMTEEEKKELQLIIREETEDIIEQLKSNNCGILEGKYHFNALKEFDWLNKHHFDYRGLIDKGLAIKVTKENNPYESNM